ncbi:alpha/beta fold hydrolase [Mycobacterium tilburgii]|uniref:alpha/beta fold hydrolase n=1 Tax=Mycobacterium tilburgii TaxID=44467 RepID=UPI0016436774|nr:alpha/beta hydrolase [Mycobacterium tilburgii]
MLLHPFLMSQTVWDEVAQQLARTGRYEVFAPTMAGHNGGPKSGTWFLSSLVLADHVERQLDELGWDTAHIVGNSLGGWVAFELERRGRARSATGIAAAGGWTRWSPVKCEVIAKFVAGMPLLLLARLLGQRVLQLPFSRKLATLPLSGSPESVSERQVSGIVDDAAHCPAYFQLLAKSLLQPGLVELAETAVPVQLVLCEKDRVVPPSRFSRHFTDSLPPETKITRLDGVGHVPMFEAPERVTEVIATFIDDCVRPDHIADPPAS